MAADYSRDSFDAAKAYSGVRMQQGRTITDADWNEQLDVADAALRSSVGDAIGAEGGAPSEGGGFKVSPAAGGETLSLSAGRFYLGGGFVDNASERGLDEQPDLPGYMLPDADGVYLAYLEVGERLVSYLEDGRLREPALGGPDTAVRTRNTAQVRLLSITEAPELLEPESMPQAFLDLLDETPGRLKAFAEADTNPDPAANPCATQLLGGYRLPDNRLYRVEIHAGGVGHGGGATYKWSRDNASVRAEWLEASGAELRFRETARDSERSFSAGQWIELLDEGRELRREAGTLVRIAEVDRDMIRIDTATADGSYLPADFAHGRRLIRRWDMRDAAGAQGVVDGKLDIEGGLQIQFAPDGSFRTGDAWLIPARSVTRGILWPCDETGSLFQPPHRFRAPARRFARLAFLRRDAGVWTEIADARVRFASLSAIAKSENQVENKVNRFGDTMTGTLNIEAGLNVDLDANFGQSVQVDQNLTVKGDFVVEGDLIARDTQHQPGDVLLGDQDEDTTILHGTLRSQHTSGKLEVDDALRVREDADVDGALNLAGQANLAADLLVDGNTGLGLDTPAYRLDVDGTVRATRFIGDGSQLSNLGQDRPGLYALAPEYLYPTNEPTQHLQSDAFGRTLFYTSVRHRDRMLSPQVGMFFGGERILLDEVVPTSVSRASADVGPEAEQGPAQGQIVYRIDGRDDVRLVSEVRDLFGVHVNDFNGHRPIVFAGGYLEFTGYLSALRILTYVSNKHGKVRVEWQGAGGVQSEERFDASTFLDAPPNWNRYDDPVTVIPHLFEAPGGPGIYTIRISSGDALNLYGIESVLHRPDGRIDVPAQRAIVNGEELEIPAQDHAYLPDPFLDDGYGLNETSSGFYDEGLDAWPTHLEISVAVSDHQSPTVYDPPLNVHDHVLNTSTGTVYRVCYLKNLVAGEHQAVSNDKIVWSEVCTIDRSVADITSRTDLLTGEILFSTAESRVYRVLDAGDGSFAAARFHHRRPHNGGRVSWNIHPTERGPGDTALVSSATLWMPPAAKGILNEAEFATIGAHGMHHFAVDGTDYLAVAFHYTGSNHFSESAVYRRVGARWEHFQGLSGTGAVGIESTVIDGTLYLFTALYNNGSTHNFSSKVYRWNGTQLEHFQDIPTNGSQLGIFGEIDGTHYLIIGHHIGNAVVVHQWNGTQFVNHQTFGANRPLGLGLQEIDGESYLIVGENHGGGTHNINSRIYRWDGAQFTQHQAIPTNGAHFLESFSIDGQHYFFMPNHYNNSTRNIESHLYRWDGANYVIYQRMPTTGTISGNYHEIDGRHFLAVSSANDDTNIRLEWNLYEWDGQEFGIFQQFYSEHGYWIEMFQGADGGHYLVNNNYSNASTHNLGSKVHRWNGVRFDVDGEYRAHDERGTGGQSRPVFAAEAPDYSLLEKAAELPAWEFGNGDRNGATTYGFDTLDWFPNRNRAYTFSDGATNLTGKQVMQSTFRGDHLEPGPDATVRIADTVGHMRLSFPGCGLRVKARRDSSLHAPLGHNYYTTIPVVSDLPYGAHVWQIDYDPGSRDVVVNVDGVELARGYISHNVEAFEIYQPRRAMLPETWITLGDYLVYAEVVQTTDAGARSIAQGVRRLHALHDVWYDEEAATSGGQGTQWALSGATQPDEVGGLLVHSGNADKTVRYRLPFFGTGAIVRFRDSTDAQDFQIRLDGQSNLLSFATSAATGSLNAATGQYTASRVGELASSVAILGLPPGEHVLEVEAQTVAGRYLFLNAIDVVEPVHRANHYKRHETPFLNEMIGGGAGIDRRDLRLFDACDIRAVSYRELRERDRTKRPRVWANLGFNGGTFYTAELPFRMNVVRGIDQNGHGSEFGVRGMVYSPAYSKFYIQEAGTYEVVVHHLGTSGSSVYFRKNNQVLMFTYSNSVNAHVDSGKPIQVVLEAGDILEALVHFNNGFHSGTHHNQMSLRKLE